MKYNGEALPQSVDVDYRDLPRSVKVNIQRWGNNDQHDELIPEQCGLVELEGPKVIYAVTHDNTSSPYYVCIYDVEDGAILGRTRIIYRSGAHWKGSAYENKPFEGNTRTEDGRMKSGQSIRRSGLSLRRLCAGNLLTQELFGLPLHSDRVRHIKLASQGVWRKLVDLGLAKEYEDDGGPRWQFTD